MKNNKLIYFASLLILINLFLLKLNYDCGQVVDSMNLGDAEIHDGNIKNIENITFNNLFKLTQPLSLIILFSDKGCEICIVREIVLLNKYYSEYELYIYVYFLHENDMFLLDRLGATFPFSSFNHDNEIFKTEFNIENPMALLTDINGTIHEVHIANLETPQNSTRFYQRMASLFQSIKNGI